MSDQGELALTIRDASNELSTFSVNVGVVTAINLTAKLSLWNDFQNATVGIILGNLANSKATLFNNPINPNTPTNQVAQKEWKWAVHYHDNTDVFGALQNVFFGRHYVVSIACPDPALLIEGTDLMDLTSTAGAEFVTSFEETALAPSGGAAKIDYIELV